MDADAPSPRQIGQAGEQIARFHLEARGYRIVARNYHSRWGEIDLVARQGAVWVFVEVRTRRSAAYGTPEESLTDAKAQRLALAAQDYLERTGANCADTDWRIDLVAIRLGPNRRVLSIHHLENVVAG